MDPSELPEDGKRRICPLAATLTDTHFKMACFASQWAPSDDWAVEDLEEIISAVDAIETEMDGEYDVFILEDSYEEGEEEITSDLEDAFHSQAFSQDGGRPPSQSPLDHFKWMWVRVTISALVLEYYYFIILKEYGAVKEIK